MSRSSTRAVVGDRMINHLNVHALPTRRESARWSNALQALAAPGSLAYRPGLVARLREISRTTPLVVVANLERPALLGAFSSFATAILTDVGASSAALADVLSGAVPPLGRLSFEVPRSTDAVRDSRSDVANDTADPAYPAGAGLSY